MRHRKAGVKLNRTSSHRKAMFRNMVTSLIKHGKIRTTDAKAKELRRWGDKLVTLAKRGDLHARRQALSIVMERAVVKKLFDEAPERFGNIAGGYTRVIKLGRRPGDAASMSLVDFVSADDMKSKKSKKKAKKVEADTKTTSVKTDAPPKKEALKKEVTDTVADTSEPAGDVIDQPVEMSKEAEPAEPAVEADGEKGGDTD